MKLIKWSVIVLFFPLFFFSCNGKKAGSDEVIVKGKLSNAQEGLLLIEELTPRNMKVIDSCYIEKDGSFLLSFKPKESGFYVIHHKEEDYITLVLNKGETVEITADAKQLNTSYTLKGSKGSEILWEYYTRTHKNYQRVDSLTEVFKKSQGKPDFATIRNQLDSTFAVIFKEQQDFTRLLIEKNTNSLASLILINQRFGPHSLFTEEEDFALFEKLDKGLSSTFPENKNTLDHHQRVSEYKQKQAEQKFAAEKIAIGATVPDITLPSPDGKNIKLSSLRGKVVLLDFWAGWCAPCRQENANLVKVYKKFKNKGFEIYGVSLDKTKDIWTGAIKVDGITWTQVSDLKFWGSPVVQLFGITAIPASFLIDKQGKIIAKNLRGKELEDKLNTLF
ncbi:MAG: AhpC/TSA family protein [Lentimicrobiaceae bacterium]|nr:AhpC/TSA family protein [Lentimicrobiaceae bacterium]